MANKADVKVGQVWHIHHTSGFVDVRVDAVLVRPGFKVSGYCGSTSRPSHTYYECTNLKTGKKITVKSATKFRHLCLNQDIKEQPKQPVCSECGAPVPSGISWCKVCALEIGQ